MTLKAKICGLRTPETVRAAVSAGAAYIGFVFFEKSPRHVTPEQAAKLAKPIPRSVVITGVFVNPSNEQLQKTLEHVPLDLIQLHGTETPKRLQDIKFRFNLPVMKAITISCPDDMEEANAFQNSADMLLFDAKPPKSCSNTLENTPEDYLPGGNGLSFDWKIMTGTKWKIPWMLSGGLNADNISDALKISGARIVDISSGLEDSPGEKSIAKITAFLQAVQKDKK